MPLPLPSDFSASNKLLFIDCDSTLSAIEGIDELARLRGEACFAEVEAMTHAAMEGQIPIGEVFGRRLEIIRPTREEAARVGQMYIERAEPTAREMLAAARTAGWRPCILSAGFRESIEPLAAYLGIDWIEAVGLYFDEAGNYRGYDRDYPTTRNGGKPARIREIGEAWARAHSESPPPPVPARPLRTVMVGDGISDLETQGQVDLFVGYGGIVRRPRVEKEAQVFIQQLSELPELLAQLSAKSL
ncbi:hypothetical protein AXK11_04515 [Cephaloticoccus primus]|uniref:phosphoserine phosphatase n=1 Tax=Cephaloticoccus primus TaxID=1548207 RepID=A0A139SPP2_9BACT|nr:HAD-IB family phosphatase [Cephaloticoccus primus]KXU36421.1 hypothetical protein AXK11_04515 [Cephaloticoccus primus]